MKFQSADQKCEQHYISGECGYFLGGIPENDEYLFPLLLLLNLFM